MFTNGLYDLTPDAIMTSGGRLPRPIGFLLKPGILRSKNMCHRQLLFQQSQDCAHLTKTGEIAVDCRYPKCFNSSIHPPRCGTSKAPCSCRRYFDNPVRKITAVVPGRCNACRGC
ncbi:hypothetical protein ARMGADRAFT_72830 [Armillaria gallica]|uniref:Uncharacterized protein n=1 Tax=Armillaria gallica TaxID=47427 RepID=A0A2H3DU14_ARMGA|nr:hypothetical protein ARMGADRAFT_72830 [Armillaria gallica]